MEAGVGTPVISKLETHLNVLCAIKCILIKLNLNIVASCAFKIKKKAELTNPEQS